MPSELGEGLLPYRLRTVRVGVRLSLLVLALLAAYPVLPGGDVVRIVPYLALVAVALAGVVAVDVLPWPQLLARRGAMAWLYAWSVFDIALITIGIAVSGGGDSELFVLYAITTMFFAASYPVAGQVVLGGLTCAAYLGVVALTGWSVPWGDAVVRLAGIGLAAGMASYLARELMREMVGHLAQRRQSEDHARMLTLVAGAANGMSSLDPERVLEIVSDAVVGLGFDGSEICMFDEDRGIWEAGYHRGRIAAGYEHVQPADRGLAGVVRRDRRTVVIDDYRTWEGGVDAVRGAGFRTMAACPIFSSTELVGVLLAGSMHGRTLRGYELECLELLAAQAGAALLTARRHAERHAFEVELERQALHDRLTGLPNRFLLADRARRAVEDGGGRGGAVAAVHVDLDGFKVVNDSFGHHAGDALIAAVAQRLGSLLQPADMLARPGDDEFSVLLHRPSDADVVRVVEALLAAMRRPFEVGGREVLLTVSAGVSIATGDGPERDLLRESELAMHRAKELGGDRWELYVSEFQTAALKRLEQELELRHAVQTGQFRLEYQPIVSLATAEVTGVEALLRWDDADRGGVSPAVFIPLAEETGLMPALGAWVLRRACRDAAAWRRAGVPLRVSVNLSATQLASSDLLGDVAAALEEYHLPPSALLLEITETAVMSDVATAVAVLQALDRLGVCIALDDFGQGHSSLGYLKQFPLRSVKIDRAFVQGLDEHAADRAVVRAVVALSHELGMQVVAEGVETLAQLTDVEALGCDAVQGFLFSRPRPAEEIADLGRELMLRPTSVA